MTAQENRDRFLNEYVVTFAIGQQFWCKAEDPDHAREQAVDAEPEQAITDIRLGSESYDVVTPVYGPLEVHRHGCQHIHRLWLDGGGVLNDGWPTPEAALRSALDEDVSVRGAMPCALRSLP